MNSHRFPVRNRRGIYILVSTEALPKLVNQRIYQDFAGTFWAQNMLKSRVKLAELVPDFSVDSVVH